MSGIVAIAIMAMLTAQADAFKTKATPPRPITPDRPWTTNDDYPAEALKRRQQGTTGFSMTISALGKVTACRITQSSGSEELDRATCTMMAQKIRFKPARDAAGKQVEGEFASRLTWKLPK